MAPLDFAALLQAERKGSEAARRGRGGEYELPPRERPRLGAPLAGLPPHVWHVPEFVSADEEARLLASIERSPHERWTPLLGRRLQSLGGLPRAGGMRPTPLPAMAAAVLREMVRSEVFDSGAPPNHVLLNEYLPGQRIAAHNDGPLYAPRVAILSLGSHCAFEFSPAGGEPVNLLLPPRGLLVFDQLAYEACEHRVPAVSIDADSPSLRRLDLAEQEAERPVGERPPPPPRQKRLSFTVRRVIDVRSCSPDDMGSRLQPWEERAALARWLDGPENKG